MDDSDNRKPPPRPPGVPPHAVPVPIPLPDMVRSLQAHHRTHGNPCAPSDVLVIVSPDVAAELYRWAWVVCDPACTAYEMDHRIRPSQYVASDIVGKVLGYDVLVRGAAGAHHIQMIPHGLVGEWDRQAAERARRNHGGRGKR